MSRLLENRMFWKFLIDNALFFYFPSSSVYLQNKYLAILPVPKKQNKQQKKPCYAGVDLRFDCYMEYDSTCSPD